MLREHSLFGEKYSQRMSNAGSFRQNLRLLTGNIHSSNRSQITTCDRIRFSLVRHCKDRGFNAHQQPRRDRRSQSRARFCSQNLYDKLEQKPNDSSSSPSSASHCPPVPRISRNVISDQGRVPESDPKYGNREDMCNKRHHHNEDYSAEVFACETKSLEYSGPVGEKPLRIGRLVVKIIISPTVPLYRDCK